MIITKESLLLALESVSAGLSQKEGTEQSNYYLFQQGKLVTYNEEICCRLPCGIPENIEGAVRAKELLEVVKRLKEDTEIQCHQDENYIEFYGKDWSYAARVEDIQLDLTQIEEPGEWRELHEDFGFAASLAYSCAKKTDDKPILTYVHVHPDFVEAFDNFQICRYSINTGCEKDFLITRKCLKDLESLGMTHISETKGWTHFKSKTGLIISCRRIEEDYPDLSEFLKNNQGHDLELPKSLMEMADRASQVDDNRGVEVQVKNKRLWVTGRGAVGEYRERRPVKYEGPSIEFSISAKVLMDIVKTHTHCLISKDSLWVDGGSYVYVARFTNKEEDEDG